MKSFIKATSIIFCFLFQLASFGQNIEVSGNVSGTWIADTVKVIDNISVPYGETLTIEPGVVIEFQGYYHIDVKGNIQAYGTPLLPILFTARDTLGLFDINSPQGAWRGIIIEKERDENNPEAFFSYCHFEYAKKYQEDEIPHGAVFYIKEADNITFESCSFFRNHSFLSGGAIYFKGASPEITNCFFLENKAGHLPINNELYGYGGAVCGLFTKAVIRQNTFSNNWASGLGGGLSIDQGSPTIENNIFENNDGPLGGGLGILRSTVESTIANNLIINNFSLFFGGGIAIIGTRATLANNTFFGNKAPGAGGGAIFLNEESLVGFYNNIFRENIAGAGNLAFVFDTSIPSFHFNNIQGGSSGIQGSGNYDFENNIDADPLFIENGDHPYALHSNSPCITAGTPDHLFLNLPETDLAGNSRFQLGRIDIGAYESSVSSVGTSFLNTSESTLSAFPNPARTIVNLDIEVKVAGNHILYLVNSKGQTCLDIFNGYLNNGAHQFFIDLSSNKIGKGLYFVVSTSGGEKTTVKLLVL